MAVVTTTETVRTSRGGRPRDPSRDGVIREAILRLLGDVGYGALTMDAVAAEAGVGKATIYRRWRTKQDLVVDTISVMNQSLATPVDTGSLDGDVRAIVHRLVDVINGPVGTAIRSLLPSMQHQPELTEAFRTGPLQAWRDSYDRMWAQAEERGDLTSGVSRSVLAETTTALLVQRWLLTGEPVTHEYADETLESVVLPLLHTRRP
ncbi:TetR/AcrR family transcriptional regulator [Blastococcus sp. TF02A-26]|uniref:TetR/AcrR family transcriptional regulator n=1 Tax=Blastococcus sp. TF02A-26 TaxID=2250577 RepID=UPI000DEB4911|nr:TetR/AcrR family transcriptional regulator [Blastococcus sp. TF02A-26]RBY86845.1 TetR family transcriptional regulator [Blastococcus sp. TF02A-26]